MEPQKNLRKISKCEDSTWAETLNSKERIIFMRKPVKTPFSAIADPFNPNHEIAKSCHIVFGQIALLAH